MPNTTLLDRNNRPLKKIAIFVYGTLMSMEGNHGFMKSDRDNGEVPRDELGRLGGFVIAPVNSYFPAIKQVPTDTLAVYGQIFHAEEWTDELYVALVERLDGLEGEGYMYDRQEVQVQTVSGEQVTAYTYVWRRESLPNWPINSGYWGKLDLRQLFTEKLTQNVVGASVVVPPVEDDLDDWPEDDWD